MPMSIYVTKSYKKVEGRQVVQLRREKQREIATYGDQAVLEKVFPAPCEYRGDFF